MTSQHRKGFTLVEILVTLTIMGILTAIAWPLFSQQKAKAYRQECIAGISGAIQALETWHNTVGVYDAAGLANYKSGLNTNNFQTCQQRGYRAVTAPFTSCNNACGITVTIPDTRTNAPTDSYLLTATRNYSANVPERDKDSECNSYTINDLGTKTAIDLANVDSTAKCWLSN